jgi:hypothetical protein
MVRERARARGGQSGATVGHTHIRKAITTKSTARRMKLTTFCHTKMRCNSCDPSIETERTKELGQPR